MKKSGKTKRVSKKNSKTKNVAVFCGSLYRAGAEHVTLYLAKGLKKLGYHTEIITCEEKDYEYDVPKGIERYVLNDNTSPNSPVIIIRNLRAILKRERIDILLVITTPLCIYAMPAAIGLKLKIIVSERNDPTHFGGRKITKYLSEWLMKGGDGFVFQTHDAKKYYEKWLNGRGEIIYNPLFIDDFPPPNEGSPEKTIIAVGRLDQQKNHALLIRAFAECEEINQEYKLIIYGEGVLRPKLEELIRSLGMEKYIALPGNVPDVCERIRTASLYVLPSNFEGMPNTLIEAMALGLPCISTDCPIGGPSELIKNGINGILISVGDKEMLKEKMKEILTRPEYGRKMGQSAALIRETLSEEQILEQWANYIERIMAE